MQRKVIATSAVIGVSLSEYKQNVEEHATTSASKKSKILSNRNTFFLSLSEKFMQNSQAYISLGLDRNDNYSKENIAYSKQLIKNGANVNYVMRDLREFTQEHMEKTKTNYTGLVGQTAIMQYALGGCDEMVSYILKKGGEKSINVRMFGSRFIGSILCTEQESLFLGDNNKEEYRFESALSLALLSPAQNTLKVMKILLFHNADLSIFHDNEPYKPILLSGLSEYRNNSLFIKHEYKSKIELLLNNMKEKNLHLDSCKLLYQVLSNAMTKKGHAYSKPYSCLLM